MRKTILISVLVIVLLLGATACNQVKTSSSTDKVVKLIKDIDYYLSFDEGYVNVDTSELELKKDGVTVEMLSYDPDWTNGITIVFETKAHEKPVSINYEGYGCCVTYYDYPSKKSIVYTDVYYNEEEGDWDGMAKFINNETNYYKNGQIEKRIIRDINEDEETGIQSVYVVSEEFFDEDGNAATSID